MEDESEIEGFINWWLPLIPPYGEFTMPAKPISVGNTSIDIHLSLTFTIQNAARELCIKRLIDQGFAINRYDIIKDGKPYYQLTERGRKLKELGTIGAYEAYLAECQKMEERRISRDESVYWIQFWIAVGAVSAALYYVLEIVKYHKSGINIDFLTALFLLLSGVLMGVIITQLLRKKGE